MPEVADFVGRPSVGNPDGHINTELTVVPNTDRMGTQQDEFIETVADEAQKRSDEKSFQENAELARMREELAELKGALNALKELKNTQESKKESEQERTIEDIIGSYKFDPDEGIDVGQLSKLISDLVNYNVKPIVTKFQELSTNYESLPDKFAEQTQTTSIIERFFSENNDLDFRFSDDPVEQAMGDVLATMVTNASKQNPNKPLDKILVDVGKNFRSKFKLAKRNGSSRLPGTRSTRNNTNANNVNPIEQDIMKMMSAKYGRR